jgi:hypothetical protein
MNCRAGTGRIGIYKHVDAGHVPETESILLRRLRDSIQILPRDAHVHVRGKARLFRIPLENVNENAQAADHAVGNSYAAQSGMKTPQPFQQLLHVNIVGGGS